MKDIIRIGALGGLDENGKTLYVIEINKDIFILECGLRYPDRNTPGIDFVIPNIEYLLQNKMRVRAYIISHGHDDLMGGLPFIYPQVPAPIYATNTTIGMIKNFTAKSQKNVAYDFHEILPTSVEMICGRKFSFFQTATNISNSFGVAISTDQGNIVYTGEYIIEYSTRFGYQHDLNALGKVSEDRTLVLLSESSFADRPGYTSPTNRLTPHIERILRDSHGRHFIATYEQNNYNIQEIFDIAFLQNKKIALYNKETEEAFELMKKADPTIARRVNLIDLEDLPKYREADEIILMVGQGEVIYREIALLANEENEDKRLCLKQSDTFIIACPPALSVEVLATDAIDDLYRSGVKVVNLTRKDFIAMHASQEDLKMMISILKPSYYIPVSGEYRHLISNALMAVSMSLKLSHQNIFVIDNGMIVEFENGVGKILQNFLKTGDILIDGLGIGDVGSQVIQDRQKLSDDGVVVMALAVDSLKRQIVTMPDIQMRGFVFVKDADLIIKTLAAIMIEETKSALATGTNDFHSVQDVIYDRAQKVIRKDTGRNPMIVPIITSIIS